MWGWERVEELIQTGTQGQRMFFEAFHPVQGEGTWVWEEVEELIYV